MAMLASQVQNPIPLENCDILEMVALDFIFYVLCFMFYGISDLMAADCVYSPFPNNAVYF